LEAAIGYVLHDFHNKRKESPMLRITDREVKKQFLEYRTLGAAVCLVAAVMAFTLVCFTVSADQPTVKVARKDLNKALNSLKATANEGGLRSASVPDFCVPGSSGCPVSDLVPGSGRYFYPGSGNYQNDNGTPCSTTHPCRYTGPRTPGGLDTDIARFRDGVPKNSITCGFGVFPAMAILALRPRVNGTAQIRVNALGQSTAPKTPFNDGTYEWYIMQVCTGPTPQHPDTVTTYFEVKTCSTVDDADPTSNDNNISTFTTNPNTQLGACQPSLTDNVVNYSMSYNETSMTPCWDTSSAPDPTAFKILTLTSKGERSPNLGIATNVPAAPIAGNGALLTCAGATIEVTPWDGDECDGLEFHKWRGACSGTGACTVGMTDDTLVTAQFTAHECEPGKVWEPGACGCVARATK
jgi:hypothetical protein